MERVCKIEPIAKCYATGLEVPDIGPSQDALWDMYKFFWSKRPFNGLFDIHTFGIGLYRYYVLELEVLGIGPNQDALWDMHKWSI